ncbi:MAG: hypothetical protein AB1742_13395, partial [bacterium]
ILGLVKRNRAAPSEQFIEVARNLQDALNTVSAGMMAAVREQSKTTGDIKARLDRLEENVKELARGGVKAIQIEEVKDKILSMRQKIKEKDEALYRLRESIAVLKRENTQLRDFKQRRLESSEEKIREVKAYRKTPLLKRLLTRRP